MTKRGPFQLSQKRHPCLRHKQAPRGCGTLHRLRVYHVAASFLYTNSLTACRRLWGRFPIWSDFARDLAFSVRVRAIQNHRRPGPARCLVGGGRHHSRLRSRPTTWRHRPRDISPLSGLTSSDGSPFHPSSTLRSCGRWPSEHTAHARHEADGTASPRGCAARVPDMP